MDDRAIRLFTIAVGLPRENGQAERLNKTVLDALATMGTRTTSNNWDSNIVKIQQGINSTKHRITKATPSELLLGYKLQTDNDMPDSVAENEELINVTKLRKEAAQRLERNRLKQDLLFNKKRKTPKMFQVGDLVLTKVTSVPGNHESKKLQPKFRGPSRVVEILPNDRYRVKEDRNTTRSSRPYEGVVGLESLKYFKFHDN
ncbi:hypothetical protein QE152_g32243 [Popillia japonica]|uniref:Integrase catalytic domain-containing protein n=1 Tax=Popillia japonica TaxID=7064 RepID=A0AAW1IZR0_POPJA